MFGNSPFGFSGSGGGGGGGTIGGGGTLNYLCKFTPDGTTIGNSQLFDNGTSVGIGTITPDASSILDLTSTSKGFLSPRMTTTERDAISAPVNGLFIYNTTTSFFNYWNGSSWTQIDTATGGDVSGSGTTNRAVMWTDGANSVIGNSTWYYSTNDYLPVTSGSNIGDATHRIGTIFMASVFDYSNNLTWVTSSSTKMTLTTSGSLGIGTDNPLSTVAISNNNTTIAPQSGTGLHVVQSGTGLNARITIETNSDNTLGSIVQGRKSRGTSASPSAALANDSLSLIGADGYGITGYHGISVGAMIIKAEENMTDTSAPTYIAFNTTPTASITSVERWRIGSSGTLTNSAAITSEAYILLKAGTTTIAPLQLTSGSLTTTTSRKSGQIQYNSGVFYGTTADATAEKPFSLQTGIFTTGSVVFVDGSGILAQDNSNFFWDDTNNRLGIGTATPIGSLEIVGTASPQDFYVTRYSADNQAGGIIGRKARGTSGAPTAVLSGDTLSLLGGRGYGATGFSATNKANVSIIAAENWSDTAQGTYISFNTTTAGGTTRAEVATLNNSALTLSAIAINEVQASNIASASTTDIGAAKGNYVIVTGTTTITSLGTVQAGTRRIVTFSGALILTYNAVSLILPTSANITTSAGDSAVFISLGSGNWRCVQYQRNDGSSLGYTFSTGLTNTANTITNNLSTGVSGGQTAIGGTAVGDVLTLKGTTGNGTSTVAAIVLAVGNNGGTTALQALNSGYIAFPASSSSSKLTIREWTAASGYHALYFGTAAAANGNFGIMGTSTATVVNGSSSLNLQLGGGDYLALTSAQLQINSNATTFLVNSPITSIASGTRSSGSSTAFTVTSPASTNQTASTEVISVRFNMSATLQHATGAITTQRDFVVDARTHSAVAASTITNAATLAITGSPIAGTNATITNAYALWVQGGVSKFGGNIQLTQTVTTEALTSDTSVTIVINGTTYKLLAKA